MPPGNPHGADAPELEARALVKRYGDIVALDGVSLVVPGGGCTALVGESGSGKTTLLRSFNRLTEIDSGRAFVDGRDVTAGNAVSLRRSIGYAPQGGGLLPHWSVLRNAALVPWLRGEPQAEERARWALALVNLPAGHFGDRWPRELSGGQRQRAALARALAGGARVLLLDEPFGALDAISRASVHRAFARLRDTLGLTVLLVTHDLTEAFSLADRVAVMRGGRIEREAPTREIREDPGSEYVAELFERAGVV